ncbi:MAG TPA: exonuclease domain-containing protein [Myxococcota bacterium]|nr:exonuclease domain-containing protein [Myxococcota bacterium]HNH47411.1 exonuclease domain-containing protein [Myxococcota bacterium]
MSTPTIWEQELISVDLETTGLRATRGDRVIEVAVARGRRGERPRSWSTLLNPGKNIRTTGIHGITEADLEGQPTFLEILPLLDDWLAEGILVAHHASVDLSFLVAEYRRVGRRFSAPPTLDTLGLARSIPELPGRSLSSLSSNYGLPVQPNHRAEADALATWYLSWTLLEQLDPAKSLSITEALELGQRGYSQERQQTLLQLRQAFSEDRPLWVEYQGVEERSRRRIRLRRVGSKEVIAWCELRQEERHFRVDRIRILPLDAVPPEKTGEP